MVVVTGKGGVGKTVVSAALGAAMAARGSRVRIVEADARENLHLLLGVDPTGGAVMDAGRGLTLQNVSPRAVLDDLVRERLKIGALSRRVLASPIYQHFASAAPGLKEMMLLGHALQVAEGEAKPPADVVVLDAPASGHALAVLEAPQLVAGVITSGPLSAMAKRIAALIADPDQCAIVLVTLAEDMPVQETLETARQIEQRLGRPPSLVIVNAVWPPIEEEAAAGPLWATRRAMNDRELARLRKAWTGPSGTLPLVGADFGPELLAAVRTALEAWLPPRYGGPRGKARRAGRARPKRA